MALIDLPRKKKYEQASSFGVITSLESNISYDSTGKHVLAPALEKVGIWHVRQGICTKTLAPSSSRVGRTLAVTSIASSGSTWVDDPFLYQMVRRECVTKRNRVSAVTTMVVEPLTVVSSSAIQIHQWWEQNPNSLLLMAETGGGYSLASYYTCLGLFVISVPGLWSLIKRSIKSKIVRKMFVVSEGEGIKKEPKQVAGEILSFFARKNFNITD